jgi:hypothetical protein
MSNYEKYDKVIIGFIAGLILPIIIGLVIYIFSHGGQSIHSYISRIANSKIITHSITLCVFPNVLVFLLFNWLDMLRTTRGVLTITIIWAVIVFGVKFLL